ncbi:hypothetical protein [Corynebacterium sp. H113]|uniref:hypothetical protein n=1 Tax=Corynebacterium sp. H113 TaxID=3133419 RepID=UPI00309DB9E3
MTDIAVSFIDDAGNLVFTARGSKHHKDYLASGQRRAEEVPDVVRETDAVPAGAAEGDSTGVDEEAS